jgi:hypothetical protein
MRASHGDKALGHDPAEVAHLREAVRQIVDEGLSMAAVVGRLNANGVPSPRGFRTLTDGSKERILWTRPGSSASRPTRRSRAP